MAVGFSWGTTKPPPGVPLDWGHPLTNGLVIAAPLNEGSGLNVQNYARPAHPGVLNLPATATAWGADRTGVALVSDGVSDHTTRFPILAIPASPGYSIVVGFTVKTLSGGSEVQIVGTTDGDVSVTFLDDKVLFWSEFSFVQHHLAVTAGPHYQAVCVQDGMANTKRVWQNGEPGTSTTTAGAGFPGTYAELCFLTGIRNGFLGLVDYFFLYNRVLNDQEIKQLYAEPFGMFVPPVFRRHFTPGFPTYDQYGYRWRDDDGDEDGASWLASQDTPISRSADVTTRLRIGTDSDVADPPSQALKLQWRKAGDTDWHDVGVN